VVAVREEEVKLRGIGFVKEVGFKPEVKDRWSYTGWAKKVIPLVQCNIISRGITFLAHPVDVQSGVLQTLSFPISRSHSGH